MASRKCAWCRAPVTEEVPEGQHYRQFICRQVSNARILDKPGVERAKTQAISVLSERNKSLLDALRKLVAAAEHSDVRQFDEYDEAVLLISKVEMEDWAK